MPEEVPQKINNALQTEVDELNSIKKQSPFPVSAQSTYIPNPNLKSLRTFQGDMQQHIEDKHESVASIVLAEQKKKYITPSEYIPEKNPHTIITSSMFVIGSIILLSVGGLVLGGVYFFNQHASTTISIQETTTPIPYTSKKTDSLSIVSNDSLIRSLEQDRNTFTGKTQNVLYVELFSTGVALTPETFIHSLKPFGDDTLNRNVKQYMTGVFSYTTNELFIILTPSDYGLVYSGMLQWETTLAQDMKELFPKLKESLINGPVYFSDETFQNKNVRVIKNNAGEVVFIYGFIDKDTLVLTANDKIFSAILTQYQNKKLAR